MTCQHPACSFHVFATCTNHCTKNVCLKHLMEHGDIFIHDYTNALNQLDQATNILMKEVSFAMGQTIQRRDQQIEQTNRKYDEEQQKLRKQVAFAEATNQFFKEKQKQLSQSKEKDECLIAQHDFEQLKSYINQMKKTFPEPLPPPPSPSPSSPPQQSEVSNIKRSRTSDKIYSCPLVRPNVFGIKHSHNIRLDCSGPKGIRWTVAKHMEFYHRMLPECAMRVVDALCKDLSPDQTKLFSENEILLNEEYFVDCPLTNSTNVFGARTHIRTLVHLPCSRKQLAFPSMMNHLTLYHRMKPEIAKIIFHAIKTKSLSQDSILFEEDQRVAGVARRI